MGGTGSGRPRWRNRGTVERSTRLTLKFLRGVKPGALRGGEFHLQDGAAFTVVRHPVHFGGSRPWFLCACGRRCGALFRAPAGQHGTLADSVRGYRLGCRRCARVSYRSQSGTAAERCRRRAFALYDRLNIDYRCAPRQRGPKPRAMRWRTYWTLYARARALDTRALLLSLGSFLSSPAGRRMPARKTPRSPMDFG